MITISGQRIEPLAKFGGKYAGTPNVLDVMLGMSRMGRFAGQTRRWWNVLLHSIVCYEMAYGETAADRLVLLCLLHDAHEGITGDAAAFWKQPDVKLFQHEIDERFFTALDMWPITPEEEKFVKDIDNRALRAEAQLVGPPLIMQHLAPADGDDERTVEQVMSRFPKCADSEGLDSPAAIYFLDAFSKLYRSSVNSVQDDSPFTQPTSAK